MLGRKELLAISRAKRRWLGGGEEDELGGSHGSGREPLGMEKLRLIRSAGCGLLENLGLGLGVIKESSNFLKGGCAEPHGVLCSERRGQLLKANKGCLGLYFDALVLGVAVKTVVSTLNLEKWCAIVSLGHWLMYGMYGWLFKSQVPEKKSIEHYCEARCEPTGALNSTPSRAVPLGLSWSILSAASSWILLLLMKSLSGAPWFPSVSRNGYGGF